MATKIVDSADAEGYHSAKDGSGIKNNVGSK